MVIIKIMVTPAEEKETAEVESEIPAELKYTREHEWLKIEATTRTRIGITDYAQRALTDIVYVEIAVEPGAEISAGDVIGTVESVKSASDIYSPVSGKVVDINRELPEAPDTINKDPYGKGWFVLIELTNADELESLLSAEQYREYLKSLE